MMVFGYISNCLYFQEINAEVCRNMVPWCLQLTFMWYRKNFSISIYVPVCVCVCVCVCVYRERERERETGGQRERKREREREREETRKEGSKGVQGMPPQNMWLCHIDCFELNAVEKQQVQKSIWPPILSLKPGDETPMWRMLSLHQGERKRQRIETETGNWD